MSVHGRVVNGFEVTDCKHTPFDEDISNPDMAREFQERLHEDKRVIFLLSYRMTKGVECTRSYSSFSVGAKKPKKTPKVRYGSLEN